MASSVRPKCCLPWAILAACVLGLVFAQPCTARIHRRMAHARKLAAIPTSGLCAQEGPAASSTFMNATRTCLKLHSSGAPIQVPADTNTTRWGQIFLELTDPVSSSFIDRDGNTYPIDSKANPPSDELQLMQIWVLILVKANLTNGTVTKFTPVLYVPYSTLMSTMAGTKFEGLLYNTEPRPKGPKPVSWFRWTFGSKITVTNSTQKYGTLLHGTFDNLFSPIEDKNGKCQPALCADPTRKSDACQYYTQFFGNVTAMTLNWDPNMHAPVDTELVPMFTATHRQYMTRFIELYNLMQPSYRFVPQRYTFIGHGTPMGVPQNFVGVLSPATKAVKCKL